MNDVNESQGKSQTMLMVEAITGIIDNDTAIIWDARHHVLNALQSVMTSVEMMGIDRSLTPEQKLVLARLEESTQDLERRVEKLISGYADSRKNMMEALVQFIQQDQD